MRLAILTPLFPPDTGHSAKYAKLLAEHLAKQQCQMIAYGKLPEQVKGVEIYPISKRGSKILLILQCIRKLKQLKPTTLLVLNGPSSDLPALLFSYLSPAIIIYIISDCPTNKSSSNWLKDVVHKKLVRRASTVIELPEETNLFIPAEILPFQTPTPTNDYDSWWQRHTKVITDYAQ